MQLPYVLWLLAATTVGFALVRCTPISALHASELGFLAGAGYWTYIAVLGNSDDWTLDRELTLTIAALWLATMFAAWLVGVVAAAFWRRRASVQS